jgi:hypothetical protein
MLATLYCKSTKLSEQSSSHTFYDVGGGGRCIFKFAALAVLTTVKEGVGKEKNC